MAGPSHQEPWIEMDFSRSSTASPPGTQEQLDRSDSPSFASSSSASYLSSDSSVGEVAIPLLEIIPKEPPSAEPLIRYGTRAANWCRFTYFRYLSLTRRFSRLFVLGSVIWFFICWRLFLRSAVIEAGRPFSLVQYSPAMLENGVAGVGFAERGHHIPPQIWQVMFTPFQLETGGFDFDESLLPYTASWLAKNPDWRYTVLGTEGAARFVLNHFSDEQRILDAHFGLRNHGPRSDLMRYLIMLAEGGVYSDTDVTCLRPVDTWIPKDWRPHVKAIVGIEGDSLGGDVVDGMLWDVQFGQWTVAAVPGHRLFRRMLDQMLDRLDDLVKKKGTTIDQLEMTALEIMNTTAPAGWSEVVFAELKRIDPSLNQTKDLSGMREPRLYGDILVLPIDGFGMGVQHSGSTHDGTIPEVALVQHHFHGSWRSTDGIEQ